MRADRLKSVIKPGIGLMVMTLFLGCRPERVTRIELPPAIRIVSVSPLELTEFTDRVTVELGYEDGDGDMGSLNPDELMLEVKDDRLEQADFYFVPPLSPPGSNVPIRGTLIFRLNGTFLFGNGAYEETRFTIRLRDRSGFWSNTVVTPIVRINRRV
ncbi:MAG: hypothetical protein FJ344_07115 [Sphingomonadales bacterium]|nr:hypothetical protein [Sphingomonadales bacterium]